jgi:hypothetical protein
MSVTTVMTLPVFKELRALAIPALACLACMVVPALIDAHRFLLIRWTWLGGIAIPAYFLGTATLGALSMGHEYSGRTLSLLLSLPVSRARLLAVKLGTLAAVLAILWIVARSSVFGIVPVPPPEQSAAALLPMLCALFLAPWLTMACRNPVAGAIFTVAIPGVLLVAGELIGVAKYGDTSVMHAFRFAFVWFGTLGVCAIGCVMTWWMFVRLEAIEGLHQDVRVPYWWRVPGAVSKAAAEVKRRNPIWLLIEKELRLQHLPFTLAVLCIVVWVLAASSTRLVSDMAYNSAVVVTTVLYAALVSIVIGSSASAVERQMGTLQWQVLLPVAASSQWAIKVTVVLGLAVALGFGLPTVLVSTGSLLRGTDPNLRLPVFPAIAIIAVLAAGSLYVSTLCRTGLWALVMSIPAMVAATMFLRLAFGWTLPISIFAAQRVAGWMATAGTGNMQQRTITVIASLLIGCLIAVLLRFARANHCSADPATSRVWKQVILTAAFATAAIMAIAILQSAFLIRSGRHFSPF